MKIYGKKFWEKVENFAKECLKDQDITHNFTHTERVLRNLKKLCRGRNIDRNLIKLACLLHDTGYSHDLQNHHEASCQIAREFLTEINFNENDKEKIIDIIENHHGSWSRRSRCPEGKLLWAADKMDWTSPYGLFRALIQNSSMNSFREIIDWYLESVKKLEIDKVDDENLKSEILKNWKITQKLLKKLKLVNR